MGEKDTARKEMMPLKTDGDIANWLEHTINDISETNESMKKANSRIACINAFTNLLKLKMAYEQLVAKGMETTDLGSVFEKNKRLT